jgi:hypothetical protein
MLLVLTGEQCLQLSMIVYNINMHPINYKYENCCQVLKDARKQYVIMVINYGDN